MAKHEPPRLAVLLLRLCLPKRSFEAITGDLFEEYNSGTRSRSWFWGQAFSSLPRRFGRSPGFSGSSRTPRRRLLETTLADVRYAVRTLRRTPGVTAAILLATALGVGVNTGIFSLMNALVLRPLPVRDSGRVISMYQIFHQTQSRSVDGTKSLFSWSEYQQYRDHNQVLTGLAAYAPFGATLAGVGGGRPVQGQLVSCNYFAVLGRTPVLGREFADQECKSPDASPYVVLNYAFWQTQFQGDKTILGRSVVVNRHTFTIIGVAPEGFPGTFMGAADFWVPVTMQYGLKQEGPTRYLEDANLSWLYLLGRLKPGVSMDQVRANLAVIAKRIDQSYLKRETKLDIQAASLFSEPEARHAILSVGAMIMLAVGLVLVIACANVANLLLARASGRQREIAVRLSIGATRFRLVKQLLTESLLLALAGGLLGALFSFWTFQALYRWMFANLPSEHGFAANTSPDVHVLGFSLALSLVTGLGFGLLPALQATRLDLNTVLKQEGRAAGWRSRGWLRSMLLAAQVAICTVLLVAAGLITRGLIAAQARDPGFTTRNVVVASFDLGHQGYDEARALQFHQLLTDRLRSQPGVQAVALASVIPLTGSMEGDMGVPEGHDRSVQLAFNEVSPEYFSVLDLPIVHGRGFRQSENAFRDPVTVVSESTARRFWPGTDPVGKRIVIGDTKVPSEVVGVAKDVYATDLFTIDPIYIYRPANPHNLRLSILVQGNNAGSLVKQVRAIAGSLDPNVLVNAAELRDNLDQFEAPSKMLVVLSSALGLIALLLTATGIFGVVNYTASRRTHEIGTRMALGADAGRILRLVISQSLRPVLVGAVLGLLGAAAVSRILTSLLFGVSPLDPWTFLSVLATLVAVAALASYGPARRATRIDPSAALRHE